MKPITFGQAQQLTSPNPFCLISTCDADGRNNLMALSWWTYLSNHPATIGVCLSRRGYSGTLIQETGEFCLCIPDVTLTDAAFRCGTCSGRDMDKAAAFGIELEEAEAIKPLRVVNSRLVMECRLIDQRDVQDHTLYIAEVVGCFARPDAKGLYAADGYRRLCTVSPDTKNS